MQRLHIVTVNTGTFAPYKVQYQNWQRAFRVAGGAEACQNFIMELDNCIAYIVKHVHCEVVNANEIAMTFFGDAYRHRHALDPAGLERIRKEPESNNSGQLSSSSCARPCWLGED